MQLSLSRPSNTGTAFFQDCKHRVWISVLPARDGKIFILRIAKAGEVLGPAQLHSNRWLKTCGLQRRNMSVE
jgi:hypothetical protein